MKNKYNTPTIDISLFTKDDIITTSTPQVSEAQNKASAKLKEKYATNLDIVTFNY